jgi:UDP-glucose 4-epimerase
MTELSVLVTGGAGYIEAGRQVVVLDNLSTGSRELIPAGVPLFQGEISDRSLVSRILKERHVNAIMHFAGSIVVPESVEQPLSYYQNNTVASHSLLQVAVEAGVEHFVFSSTAAVYGSPEKPQVGEDDPKEPINPYGASKLMTERMLADASAVHKMNYAVLRYFNVAGADPLLRTGQIKEGSTHLIKVSVEAALGARDHVAVYGTDYPTPDGTCIRDYIHVSDLALAHVAALDWLIANAQENLVINCGYGRGLSVLEVLDAVDRVNGKPIKRVYEGRRVGDPAALISSNTRLGDTLNWRPFRGEIDWIVRDALAWEKKRLEKALGE